MANDENLPDDWEERTDPDHARQAGGIWADTPAISAAGPLPSGEEVPVAKSLYPVPKRPPPSAKTSAPTSAARPQLKPPPALSAQVQPKGPQNLPGNLPVPAAQQHSRWQTQTSTPAKSAQNTLHQSLYDTAWGSRAPRASSDATLLAGAGSNDQTARGAVPLGKSSWKRAQPTPKTAGPGSSAANHCAPATQQSVVPPPPPAADPFPSARDSAQPAPRAPPAAPHAFAGQSNAVPPPPSSALPAHTGWPLPPPYDIPPAKAAAAKVTKGAPPPPPAHSPSRTAPATAPQGPPSTMQSQAQLPHPQVGAAAAAQAPARPARTSTGNLPPPPLHDPPAEGSAQQVRDDEPPISLVVTREGLDRRMYFRRLPGAALGLKYVRRDDKETLQVTEIIPGAAVSRWNQTATVDTAIHVGDHILAVNEKRCLRELREELSGGGFLKIEVLRGQLESNAGSSRDQVAGVAFGAQAVGGDVGALPLRHPRTSWPSAMPSAASSVGVGPMRDQQYGQHPSMHFAAPSWQAGWPYPNADAQLLSQVGGNAPGAWHREAGGAGAHHMQASYANPSAAPFAQNSNASYAQGYAGTAIEPTSRATRDPFEFDA